MGFGWTLIVTKEQYVYVSTISIQKLDIAE